MFLQQKGTQVFKYKVQYKLLNGSKPSTVVKDEADLDLENQDHLDYFAARHKVVEVIEKIFGAGTCQMWMVVEKQQGA